MNLALPELDQPLRLRFGAPVSDSDLLKFCTDNELLRVERDANGELIVMSPTGAGTGRTNSELNFQLALWARESNAGVTFDSNAGFTLADGSMRSPDAAFISWPRWNALTKEQQDGFAPISPEFVIELRSPSDSLHDLHKKMQIWIYNGVELAWLIDPSRKAVETYRPNRQPEILEGGSIVEGEGPVAGFVLELDRIWN